uniref:J domain-containing protein n=1 Tax=viral metagenome TaxID=1070528 RepID=A0A6C0J4R7_9ZZZZ
MDRDQCCKVLGLKSIHTKKELNSAYKAMSKKYHPDLVGPAGKPFFIQITNAYKTLLEQFSKKAKNINQSGSSFEQMKKVNRKQEQPNLNRPEEKEKEKFNKQFDEMKQQIQGKTNSEYMYNNNSEYVERTRQQFESENSEINNIIYNNRPIMQYNPQDFNNYFEQVKRSNTGIDLYNEQVQPVHNYSNQMDLYGQSSQSGQPGQSSQPSQSGNLGQPSQSGNLGQSGNHTDMGMYSIPSEFELNRNTSNFVMQEQPLSQQEIQQRMSQRNNPTIFSQPGPLGQPGQPGPLGQSGQSSNLGQSSPLGQSGQQDLIYNISENQQLLLQQLKQNNNAMSNSEIIKTMNKISSNQEKLLKRFNY